MFEKIEGLGKKLEELGVLEVDVKAAGEGAAGEVQRR